MVSAISIAHLLAQRHSFPVGWWVGYSMRRASNTYMCAFNMYMCYRVVEATGSDTTYMHRMPSKNLRNKKI